VIWLWIIVGAIVGGLTGFTLSYMVFWAVDCVWKENPYRMSPWWWKR
jgi:hypothetical protein